MITSLVHVDPVRAAELRVKINELNAKERGARKQNRIDAYAAEIQACEEERRNLPIKLNENFLSQVLFYLETEIKAKHKADLEAFKNKMGDLVSFIESYGDEYVKSHEDLSFVNRIINRINAEIQANPNTHWVVVMKAVVDLIYDTLLERVRMEAGNLLNSTNSYSNAVRLSKHHAIAYMLDPMDYFMCLRREVYRAYEWTKENQPSLLEAQKATVSA